MNTLVLAATDLARLGAFSLAFPSIPSADMNFDPTTAGQIALDAVLRCCLLSALCCLLSAVCCLLSAV
jgi:hypothetical protein